jgi:TolB-like protein
LVDAANQNQIWGGKYEITNNDISLIEDSIITSLMNPLRIVLVDKSKGIPQNKQVKPEAYAEYLKGRYLSYGSHRKNRKKR